MSRRINQNRINQMPASTLKQLQNKELAQKRLNKALASVESFNHRLDSVKKADETESDLSQNFEDVVVQSLGDKNKGTHSLIEADFRGNKIKARFRDQDGLLSKRDLCVKSDGKSTRYFQTSLSMTDISKGSNYSYQDIRVTEENGETLYEFKEGGGAWSQRVHSLKAGLQVTAGVFSVALAFVRNLGIMDSVKSLPKKYREHREKVSFERQVQAKEKALLEQRVSQAAEARVNARMAKEGEKLVQAIVEQRASKGASRPTQTKPVEKTKKRARVVKKTETAPKPASRDTSAAPLSEVMMARARFRGSGGSVPRFG